MRQDDPDRPSQSEEASNEIPSPGGEGHSQDPVPEAPADAQNAVPSVKGELPAEKLPPGVAADIERAQTERDD